jgi:hypothetical protein
LRGYARWIDLFEEHARSGFPASEYDIDIVTWSER